MTVLKILKIFMKKDVFMTTFENDNLIMPMSDDGGGSTSKELNIEAIDQRDYGTAFCLATCYLVIGKYYHPNENLTMSRLQQETIVSSTGDVNRWGDYVTRGEKQDFNKANIKTALAAGKPVIISGKIKNSTFDDHYVVAYGYAGNDIKIMDPWGGTKGVLGYTNFIDYENRFFRVCTK